MQLATIVDNLESDKGKLTLREFLGKFPSQTMFKIVEELPDGMPDPSLRSLG